MTSTRARRGTIGPGAIGALALVAITLVGCEDEETGAGCEADDGCQRGQICEDGRCTVMECNHIRDCPSGSGQSRTCLLDMKQCSPKECADTVDGQEVTCPESRPVCVEEFAYTGTCIGEDTVQCENAGDCGGLACCEGVCRAQCPDSGVIMPEDDAGAGGADGGAGDVGPVEDAGVEPDMGPDPMGGGLCAACDADEDCADLGEGARCTPLGGDGAFCTSACEGDEDCPEGYQCLGGVNQCVPPGLRCTGCVVDGCPEGQVCDANSGECTEPRGVCGSCRSDDACAEGLSCGAVGDGTYCLEPCQDGACAAEGFSCTDGTCAPDSGVCDACAGQCGGETPYCVADEARCAECGPGFPCEGALSCNLETFTCQEAGSACLSDLDCQDPTLPICFGGECVGCLQDTDCPARNACDAGSRTCMPSPCAGVMCQRGSECNPETGRCDPGCQAAADCASPDIMDCNVETGQCFYTDGGLFGACDVGGGDAVCPPGGVCTLNPLDGMMRGVCNCWKVDPADPMSPDRVGCHPGYTCLQFASMDPNVPAEPGACVGF